jgi:ABC-type uncharacterized transport system substrate-binding protein
MEGVCSAQVQAQNKHSGGDRDAMKKNVFCLALGAMLFAICFSAAAQQPKKVQVIGYLSPVDPATDSPRAEGIRVALRELGYMEGKNIAIEYRYVEGKNDRAAELAAELVRLKVDLIVAAGGTFTVRAVMSATKTIPIVCRGTVLSKNKELNAILTLVFGVESLSNSG